MALDALCLLPTVVDFEVVSRVLRGAYLTGSDAEAGMRARVERRIRERLVGGEITRTQLMARALSGAPLLAQALRNAWKASRKCPRKGQGTLLPHLGRRIHDLSCANWAGRATGRWSAASSRRWKPSAACLRSTEAATPFPPGPSPLAAALSRLGTMARERKFQPQGPDRAVELLPVGEVGRHALRSIMGGGRGRQPVAARNPAGAPASSWIATAHEDAPGKRAVGAGPGPPANASIAAQRRRSGVQLVEGCGRRRGDKLQSTHCPGSPARPFKRGGGGCGPCLRRSRSCRRLAGDAQPTMLRLRLRRMKRSAAVRG